MNAVSFLANYTVARPPVLHQPRPKNPYRPLPSWLFDYEEPVVETPVVYPEKMKLTSEGWLEYDVEKAAYTRPQEQFTIGGLIRRGAIRRKSSTDSVLSNASSSAASTPPPVTPVGSRFLAPPPATVMCRHSSCNWNCPIVNKHREIARPLPPIPVMQDRLALGTSVRSFLSRHR